MKITKKIAQMIALDSQAFSMPNDTGFLRLMQHLAPKYTVPSGKYFSCKAIPELYEQIKNYIQKELAEEKDTFFSFTTDIWSRDCGGDSFISWTAHYIKADNFEQSDRLLHCAPFPGSHTGAAISEMITEMLENWSLEKPRVHLVLRDNAANMIAGCREANVSSASCAIHSLQLVVKDGQLSQKSVTDTLARARKVVGHFKHSSLGNERLAAIQKQLDLPQRKLIQDEPTTWDSTYQLLERLVEQKRAIILYHTDFGLPVTFRDNDWRLAEKMVTLLEPFQRLTKEFSKKESTLSEVIPFVSMLKMELSTLSEQDRGVKTSKGGLLQSLNNRFKDIYENYDYLLATACDPRFTLDFFDDQTAESVSNRLVVEMEKLEGPASTTSVTEAVASEAGSTLGTSDSGDSEGSPEIVTEPQSIDVDQLESTAHGGADSSNVTSPENPKRMKYSVWQNYAKFVKKKKPESQSDDKSAALRKAKLESRRDLYFKCAISWKSTSDIPGSPFSFLEGTHDSIPLVSKTC